MAEALRHRGPDGEAVRRFGPATLACTRLAIIDVVGGDQPLLSEDGEIALVANGEIYNHGQLRSELGVEGHRFATGSDCEVLVHAYEEHGLEFRPTPQRDVRAGAVGRSPGPSPGPPATRSA